MAKGNVKNSQMLSEAALFIAEYMDEEVCNIMEEKIIQTFDSKSTLFVVAGYGVEDWLENDCHIGRSQFILSTTVCNDVEQTVAMTDRYKRIVLSEEFINNWPMLRSMPERTRNKLEIVVNIACPNVCPLRKKHYEHISRVNITGELLPEGFKCCNETYLGEGYLYEIIDAPHFVSHDKIQAYLDMGINHFKISGRTSKDFDLIETVAYYLIKPQYQMMFRMVLSKARKIVEKMPANPYAPLPNTD